MKSVNWRPLFVAVLLLVGAAVACATFLQRAPASPVNVGTGGLESSTAAPTATRAPAPTAAPALEIGAVTVIDSSAGNVQALAMVANESSTAAHARFAFAAATGAGVVLGENTEVAVILPGESLPVFTVLRTGENSAADVAVTVSATAEYQPAPAVAFAFSNVNRLDDRTVTGTVTNTGTSEARAVKVLIVGMGETGAPVTWDQAYVADLAPGASDNFSLRLLPGSPGDMKSWQLYASPRN